MTVAAIGAVPWLVWTARRPPATGGYLQQVIASNRLNPESVPLPLVPILERGWDNVLEYSKIFPQLFWPALPPPLVPAASIPLAVRAFALVIGGSFLAFGVWRCLRSRGTAVWDLYVLFTAAILFVWPWTGDRFFLAIAPLLWLYLLVGLDAASRFLTGGSRPAVAVAGTLSALLLVGTVRAVPPQWELTRAFLDGDEFAGYDPFWQDYFQAARWIGENEPDAVIAARKPTFAWYWSGRPSLVYPFHGDRERTWRFLREQGVTHILWDPMTSGFLIPVLGPHLEDLEVIHAAPHRIVVVVRLPPES